MVFRDITYFREPSKAPEGLPSCFTLCRSRGWLFHSLPLSLTKGKEETVFTLSPLKRAVVVLLAKLCPTLSEPRGL